MLLLDGSQMETVTIPYQPSLVPYCINKQTFPLDPPLPSIFVSPPNTFLHTLPLPTESLQAFLPSLLDIANNYTSCENCYQHPILVCRCSGVHNSSYLYPPLRVSFAATYQADKAPSFKKALS